MESAEFVTVLIKEIALITGREMTGIDPSKSLSDNGINSMGFIELLLAVENRCGVKLIDRGLTSADVGSVHALAAKVAEAVDDKA